MPITVIDHWYDEPGLAALVAERVTAALGALPGGAGDTPGAAAIRAGATVVFTAHSVPTRVVEEGDDYSRQVHASAAAWPAKPASNVGRWPGRGRGGPPSPGSAPTCGR